MILSKTAIDKVSIIERRQHTELPSEMYLNVKDLKDDNKINEFLDLVNKNKVNPYYLHSPEVVNEITSKRSF